MNVINDIIIEGQKYNFNQDFYDVSYVYTISRGSSDDYWTIIDTRTLTKGLWMITGWMSGNGGVRSLGIGFSSIDVNGIRMSNTLSPQGWFIKNILTSDDARSFGANSCSQVIKLETSTTIYANVAYWDRNINMDAYYQFTYTRLG